MQSLPGRLEATTLGDLLGALHRERRTGSLEIVERGAGARTHRVFVADGLVTAVELDRASPSLGDLLRKERALDEETLRRSLLRALAQRRLHGEVLIRDFHLSPEVVGRALRTQLGLRLHALDKLADSDIRFRVAVRAPREALVPPLEPADFLHGKRRKRDEAERTPQARAVAFATESLEKREARRLLGLGPLATLDDAKRAYRELVRKTHPDLFPRATTEERRELGKRLAAATKAYRLLVD